jgi:hypothetical protein
LNSENTERILDLSQLFFMRVQAVDKKWNRDNVAGKREFLFHEDSLRLLTARRLPKYHDTSIPGMSARQIAMSSVSWMEG